MTVLKQYLHLTETLSRNHTKLLVSFVKLHKPVSKDTFSKWLKMGLTAAGMDVTIFTRTGLMWLHPVLLNGLVPMATILKTAGWSKKSTFARYYNKPIDSDAEFAASLFT